MPDEPARKGAHTPGPFYGANAMDGRPKIFKAHSDGGAIFVTRFNSASQRDEVVDLLNKGTHFDAMKEMLAACVEGMQDRLNHAEYDREDQYPWNLLAPARAILARIDGEGGE